LIAKELLTETSSLDKDSENFAKSQKIAQSLIPPANRAKSTQPISRLDKLSEIPMRLIEKRA
jgi:hypothetical protein